MDDEQSAEIMRFNIYNCLIDHNEMKKLAAETFQKIDVINEGQISLEKIQLFVKIFLKKINAKELLSKEQIETIYTECLPDNEEQLSIDDFTNYYMNYIHPKIINQFLINEQNFDINILHNKYNCRYCFSKIKRDILQYQLINYHKFYILNQILKIQRILKYRFYYLRLYFKKFYGFMVVVFGFCFCKIQNEQQQRKSIENQFQMTDNIKNEEDNDQMIQLN